MSSIKNINDQEPVEGSSTDVIKKSSWSDLPVDICRSIYQKVDKADDRGRLGSVRKDLNIIHRQLKPPFLMTYRPSESKFTCKSSLRSRFYRCSFRDAHVVASIQGWFLMKHRSKSLFCCNIFTSEEIGLPKFDPGEDTRAVFSSPPNSPDPVIFLVRSSDVTNNSVTFNLCRFRAPGEVWEQRRFEATGLGSCKSLAYSSTDKKLYSVFDNGVMGILDPESNNRNLTVLAPPLLPKGSQMVLGGNECKHDPMEFEWGVIEWEGEVVLICRCTNCSHFRIFRLDKKTMDWIQTKSLKNTAIFLNNDRLMSSSLAIYADTKELRNKIFHFRGGKHAYVWIYDMETGCHKLSKSYPSDWSVKFWF